MMGDIAPAPTRNSYLRQKLGCFFQDDDAHAGIHLSRLNGSEKSGCSATDNDQVKHAGSSFFLFYVCTLIFLIKQQMKKGFVMLLFSLVLMSGTAQTIELVKKDILGGKVEILLP